MKINRVLGILAAVLIPYYSCASLVPQQESPHTFYMQALLLASNGSLSLADIAQLMSQRDNTRLAYFADKLHAISQYFDWSAIQEFVEAPELSQQKASLRRCFNLPQWNRRFDMDCQSSIDQLIDFLFTKESDPTFIRKIDQLKDLPLLRSPAVEATLVPSAIGAFLDATKPEAKETRLAPVGPIFRQGIFAPAPESVLNVPNYEELLTYAILFLSTHKTPRFSHLALTCLKHDQLVDILSSFLVQRKIDKRSLIGNIKKYILLAKQGKISTKAEFAAFLDSIDTPGEVKLIMDRYLDLDMLFTSLAEYQDGRKYDFSCCLKIKQLESDTGIAWHRLIDRSIPAAVKQEECQQITDRLMNSAWLTKSKRCALLAVLLFCAYYTFWELLAGNSFLPVTFSSITVASALHLWGSAAFEQNPIANFAVNTGLEKGSKLLGYATDLLNSPERLARHPRAVGIEDFLRCLTLQQLDRLSHPYDIFLLAQEPLSFLRAKKNLPFILSLTENSGRAKERLLLLEKIISKSIDLQSLPHSHHYSAFYQLLSQESAVIATLPCHQLLRIGAYNPALLFNYTPFICALSMLADTRAWNFFLTAVTEADQHAQLSLL